MTASEKAVAAAARVAETRRAAGELAALLKTKQDEAAAAAQAAEKLAAEATAGATTATATTDAGTTDAPATGEAAASEDRIAAKDIAALQASGLVATPPEKPSASGGVTAVLAASPEESAFFKLYAGMQAQLGCTYRACLNQPPTT